MSREHAVTTAIVILGIAFAIILTLFILTYSAQQSQNTSIVNLAQANHANSTAQSQANRSLIITITGNQKSDTQALCSLRADVQKRVTSGEEFLKTHPNGIPGIPAPTLQASVTSSERTVKALNSLSCPK